MRKIRVNDIVLVTSGKDKGQKGKVEKVLSGGQEVLIENINMYKKHVKGSQGQKGGIYDIPKPLSIAKVSLICPLCKKPTRVGFSVLKNEKVRVCRKCGKEIRQVSSKSKK